MPYVITPATSQKPLEFRVKLKNHLASDFRGLVRVIGQSLETGRELTIRANSSETANLVVRSPLILGGSNEGLNVAITVDLPNPKEPIAKRTVPLVTS